MYPRLQQWPLFTHHFVKFQRSIIHVQAKCGKKEMNESTSLVLKYPSGSRPVPSLEEAQKPQGQFRNRTRTPFCWMVGEKFSITRWKTHQKTNQTTILDPKFSWCFWSTSWSRKEQPKLPWSRASCCEITWIELPWRSVFVEFFVPPEKKNCQSIRTGPPWPLAKMCKGRGLRLE